MTNYNSKQIESKKSFESLQQSICNKFSEIEKKYHEEYKSFFTYSDNNTDTDFTFTRWEREGGGGGLMSLMCGRVFEKVGVNTSTVFGTLPEPLIKSLPGTDKSTEFWASGISLVAHMNNPHIPAIHMNTRFICTDKYWFGGGIDLNPIYENKSDTSLFHDYIKSICDKHDNSYYDKFKKECDKYFYIKHRKESRGVGGIFFDYLNNNDYAKDFSFVQDVGKIILTIFPKIISQHINKSWTKEDKIKQSIKRGKYTEFNLVYDRGTKFGFMTDGNTDAILMSLPPHASW